MPSAGSRRVIISAPDDISDEVWYLSSGQSVDAWLVENLSDDEFDEVCTEFIPEVRAAFLDAQVRQAEADGWQVVATPWWFDVDSVRKDFPGVLTDEELLNSPDWPGGMWTWWDLASSRLDVDSVLAEALNTCGLAMVTYPRIELVRFPVQVIPYPDGIHRWGVRCGDDVHRLWRRAGHVVPRDHSAASHPPGDEVAASEASVCARLVAAGIVPCAKCGCLLKEGNECGDVDFSVVERGHGWKRTVPPGWVHASQFRVGVLRSWPRSHHRILSWPPGKTRRGYVTSPWRRLSVFDLADRVERRRRSVRTYSEAMDQILNDQKELRGAFDPPLSMDDWPITS